MVEDHDDVCDHHIGDQSGLGPEEPSLEFFQQVSHARDASVHSMISQPMTMWRIPHRLMVDTPTVWV